MTVKAKACLVAMIVAWPGTSAAAELVAGTKDPSHIYGGGPVGACEWPTAVFVNDCTGTLVHPNVVVLAAHCVVLGGQANNVKFGENHTQAERTVPVENCMAHPQWNQNGPPADNASDIAICTLAQSVDDIPIVPIAMGCETEALQPGVPVTLVGFGEADDALGYGPKRSVVTDIQMIGNDAAFIGGDGLSSCYGDSGGPSYIQLDDGSWRVFGAVSGSAVDDPNCGNLGIWTLIHPYAQWIENTSGYDVTPCHDADGTWNPSEACTEFPLAPGAGEGSWGNGCLGQLSDAAATCGPPLGGGGTTGGAETGGESGSVDDHGENDATGVGGSEGGSSDDGRPVDEDEEEDEDDGDGGGLDPGYFPAAEPAPSSCACTSGPDGRAWLLLPILFFVRRRRVSWARCRETSARATAPQR